MIRFRIKNDHALRPHTQVIEVVNEQGDLLACVYPNDNHTGIRIISKYLEPNNVHVVDDISVEIIIP